MPPKFKPGGRKFPPKSVPKNLPQQVQRPIPTTESPSTGLDEEVENNFEVELCWCIQQLELSVQSNKLSEKRMRDAQKSMNILKSSTVPLVHKRQVMRTTFGDYRVKMQQDAKRHGKNASTVKFSNEKLSENKCLFVKKANIGSTEENSKKNNNAENGTETIKVDVSSLFSKNNSEPSQPFKFNFSIPVNE